MYSMEKEEKTLRETHDYLVKSYKNLAKRNLIGAIVFFCSSIFFLGLCLYLGRPLMLFGIILQSIASLLFLYLYVDARNDLAKLNSTILPENRLENK